MYKNRLLKTCIKSKRTFKVLAPKNVNRERCGNGINVARALLLLEVSLCPIPDPISSAGSLFHFDYCLPILNTSSHMHRCSPPPPNTRIHIHRQHINCIPLLKHSTIDAGPICCRPTGNFQSLL